MNSSIKLKILYLVGTIAALFSISLSIYAPYQSRQGSREILSNDATFISNLFAENLALGMQTFIIDNGAALDQTIQFVSKKTDSKLATISTIRIFDENLQFVKGFNEKNRNNEKISKVDKYTAVEKDASIITLLPMKDAGAKVVGYVELEFSKAHLIEQAQSILWTTIFISLGIFACMMILGYLFAKSVSDSINKINLAAKEVGNGNLNVKVDVNSKDEVGELAVSFSKMVDTYHDIINEIQVISHNASEGNFSFRGNSSKFSGSYKEIIDEVNLMVEQIVKPFSITADYLDRISRGDIPQKVEINFKGELNQIKNNLNLLIDSVNLLIVDANELAHAADVGDLKKRAEVAKHQGDFQKIVIGINSTFDNLCKPLDIASEFIAKISQGESIEYISEEYRGDYNNLRNHINITGEVLQNINNEIQKLITNSVNGELSTRADAAKYKGNWQGMMAGMNSMLDAILFPIAESSKVLKAISGGDLSIKVTSNLKGDHQAMKDAVNDLHSWLVELVEYINQIASGNMNATIEKSSDKDQIHDHLISMRDNIRKLANDVSELSMQAVAGNLKARADESIHKGEYQNIVQGFNKTLDAIIAPINEGIKVLHKVANGDLTINMTGDFKGDHALLKDSINKTVESIHSLLIEVTSTIDEVNRGAVQVSNASSTLSQGATDQASSLEEITSSMSEINSQTRQNAQNATIANNLTNDAKTSSEKGSQAMSELNTAMEAIADSSRNISKIINVIDEIAFQTNLLALNAAVEAARAGRHGKGFAVVAEEVRNLAARSAQAAKETSNLIESSIRTVETGQILTSRTTSILFDIKNGAIKSADIVSEIATSSNEQASSISQISDGLSQIDKVTQNNTASAEESASAAEQLSSQAAKLREMILAFKLDLNQGQHPKALESGRVRPSRALPSMEKQSHGKPFKKAKKDVEDEFLYELNPSEIISLDEDDFDRY